MKRTPKLFPRHVDKRMKQKSEIVKKGKEEIRNVIWSGKKFNLDCSNGFAHHWADWVKNNLIWKSSFEG